MGRGYYTNELSRKIVCILTYWKCKETYLPFCTTFSCKYSVNWNNQSGVIELHLAGSWGKNFDCLSATYIGRMIVCTQLHEGVILDPYELLLSEIASSTLSAIWSEGVDSLTTCLLLTTTLELESISQLVESSTNQTQGSWDLLSWKPCWDQTT